MWTGAAAPASIAPAQTLVSYLAPDTASQRMDLVRFTGSGDLVAGENGTVVSGRDLDYYAWCANTYAIGCMPGRFTWQEIHHPGLAEGTVGWGKKSGALRLEPAESADDVSGFEAFQFRAVINPGINANKWARYQDLTVVLIDDQGASAGVTASSVGNEALASPVSGRRARGHIILNQVRFPLDLFAGVDLSDLSAVEIRFNRTRKGVLNFADVAFSNPTP